MYRKVGHHLAPPYRSRRTSPPYIYEGKRLVYQAMSDVLAFVEESQYAHKVGLTQFCTTTSVRPRGYNLGQNSDGNRGIRPLGRMSEIIMWPPWLYREMFLLSIDSNGMPWAHCWWCCGRGRWNMNVRGLYTQAFDVRASIYSSTCLLGREHVCQCRNVMLSNLSVVDAWIVIVVAEVVITNHLYHK